MIEAHLMIFLGILSKKERDSSLTIVELVTASKSSFAVDFHVEKIRVSYSQRPWVKKERKQTNEKERRLAATEGRGHKQTSKPVHTGT